MQRRQFLKNSVLLSAAGLVGPAVISQTVHAAEPSVAPVARRRFVLSKTYKLNPPKGSSGVVKLWIPLPVDTAFQQMTALAFSGNYKQAYVTTNNTYGAKTLFATHYFELTQLPEKMEGVANVHLDALEHGDTIAFMHSVQDGAASKSYGLAVAALAGVPKEVIKRARQKLRELESISPNAAATQVDGTQMSLLSVPEETSPAVEALENLDPDSLTPRQALEWIYRLKSLV